MTKSAALLLTRRFAMDLGPFGITVNAIAPGFIVTDIGAAGPKPGRCGSADWPHRRKSDDPAPSGVPEDIAHAVSFLVSPQSGFVTAQTLTVDGGRMDCMNPRPKFLPVIGTETEITQSK